MCSDCSVLTLTACRSGFKDSPADGDVATSVDGEGGRGIESVCPFVLCCLFFADTPCVDTCSLDELLSSYSVAGFYVQPVDSFDLQSLLGVGDGSEGSPQGGPPST